jgi:hypothetical protein
VHDVAWSEHVELVLPPRRQRQAVALAYRLRLTIIAFD